MRILHTADWHIGNFPGPEKDGLNLRAVDTGICINHLHDIALLQRPDMILISGDLFHQSKVWADRGLSETKTAIQAIEALSEICPVVIIRGTPNHDGEEQFEMLKAHFNGYGSVQIVTEPKVVRIAVDINAFELVHLQVAALPGFDRGVYRAKNPGLSKEEENQAFTDELGKIVLGLKAQCDPNYPSVLMSHYTVPGCNTESGQTQFLAQFEPVIMPDALDAAGFDLVALGHIHRPQQVPSCKNTFYSGALNAMNFNDEGQERGFWIHELEPKPDDFYKDLDIIHKGEIGAPNPRYFPVKSKFYTTPYREFVTFKFTDTDIAGIVTGELEEVSHNWWGWNDGVKDKIARIQYSCTEENNKAFNRSLLEKQLYDDGAFWVSEISPEKITIGTNKNKLSEKTDPEANLISHLNEKAYPDDKIGAIVEAARPIIAQIMDGNIVTRLTGTFVPLEIEVKNYRNYEEERFDFRDISFCTINGKNGAGKSSLFMDAVLDCLYEEPREGDLTGWIRADEKARSGAISFMFSIGEKVFRVSRTRAKSGKATLNLAERIEGEWVNRSAEKIKETQDRIIDVIGMDSLTFRSCALIMQDQYGLFLQASKEERMAILGNILGLGIYSDMEQLARMKATDTNRIIGQKKAVIEGLTAGVSRKEETENQFCLTSLMADDVQGDIKALSAERDNVNLQLSSKREASVRASKLLEDINTLQEKKRAAEGQIEAQKRIVDDVSVLLSDEEAITAGAAKQSDLFNMEKELLSQKADLSARITGLGNVRLQREQCKSSIDRLATDKTSTQARIADLLRCLDRETVLAEDVAKLEREKQRLEALEESGELYIVLSNDIASAQAILSKKREAFSTEAAQRAETIKTLTGKAHMLENSQCIDSANANCVFLSDAQQAKRELETYKPSCTQWKEAEFAHLQEAENSIATLIRQRTDLDYDSERVKSVRISVSQLEVAAKEYERLPAIKEQIALLEERLKSLDTQMLEIVKRLSEVDARDAEEKQLTLDMEELSKQYSSLKGDLLIANAWVEKEKLLPVARERRGTAQKRIEELTLEVSEILLDIQRYVTEHQNELLAAVGADTLEDKLKALDSAIEEKQKELNRLQLEVGGIRQILEQIEQKEKEIKIQQDEVNNLSGQASWFEILKEAFSQDGIPHNIIRSMLPTITSTANSILGQMTGGKMGMEFITDKVLKSNSKKEVPTLDIVVEEYGKDSLPYLSKSGGEKVKSSLSVILALAEVKSSQAGIQLGMLFIDEPPFLDADGIQAYCDSLETIQNRYKDLKVMAITHDPTMKARFPQSIDIVKTESGSKVELS